MANSNNSMSSNRIAHRTRSKCQLNDCSIIELEKNLPDDLLGLHDCTNQNHNRIT
jgi:hypothetical protein